MKIEDSIQSWLLEPGQPVVRYYALRELLDRKESDPDVREAHSRILEEGWVPEILSSQNPEGNWESIEDLYRPKYTATNWRVITLSDFSLNHRDDPRLERACELFFKDKEWLGDEEKFDAEGEVCISGNLARMLTRFGYRDDPRVKKVFGWLVSHQKEDGGWQCFNSDKGTLDCWEALAAFSALPKAERTKSMNASIEKGAEFYLERRLHEEGQRYDPWYRFHYPNHYYYDILVGLDVLTSLGFAGDKRLVDALQLLRQKRLPDGSWTLEAVHPDIGEGYTFREKGVRKFAVEAEGQPSKWITLTALKVLKRVDEA